MIQQVPTKLGLVWTSHVIPVSNIAARARMFDSSRGGLAGKAAFVGVSLAAAACAVRIGGPDAVAYRTFALDVAGTPAASAVAERIRGAGADVVFLSAEADSAWFGQVAGQTQLQLSGPSKVGPTALAFLAGSPVGDTTIALPVPGEQPLIVHDALYEVDDERYLDLLAVRVESATRARSALHAFLEYVATDVYPEAAVVVAVDVPDVPVGDSVAALLRPAFREAQDCIAGESTDNGPPLLPAPVGMRLFYGPELRIRCEEARIVEGEPAAVFARLVVAR